MLCMLSIHTTSCFEFTLHTTQFVAGNYTNTHEHTDLHYNDPELNPSTIPQNALSHTINTVT